MMLAQRLKEETKAQHDAVEQYAYTDKIMSKSLALAEYQDLIVCNYLFHQVVEPAIAQALGQHQAALQWHERQKMGFLQNDMAELGLIAPDARTLPAFEINSLAEALGAMYVMEGSTLGGAMICRQLAQTPGLGHLKFHFYGCYGPQTGPKWKAFMEILHQLANTPQQHDEAVAKATETFELFRHILRSFADAHIKLAA